MEYQLREYISADGKNHFREWLQGLHSNVRARILERVLRLEGGNFGDAKALGKGIYELRIHFGQGYRVYFGKAGKEIILILSGSDKSDQSKTILKAQALWAEYKRS